MKRLYSETTGCTYIQGVHPEIPADAKVISDEVFESVIVNPPAGKARAHRKGLPYLIDAAPEVLTVEMVHQQRLSAYRVESDPLKNEAEYDALVSEGAPDYTKWMEKVSEIKARYPLPASS